MAQLPLSLSDGRWHHICITWTTRDGFWEAYQDGDRLGTGDNLAPWHPIKPGGVIILGQEQVRSVERHGLRRLWRGVCVYVLLCVKALAIVRVWDPFVYSLPEQGAGEGRQTGSSHAIIHLSALGHTSISKQHHYALGSYINGSFTRLAPWQQPVYILEMCTDIWIIPTDP